MTLKCPGQDSRYWKPDDVAEVACARCGHVVEFFKTEGQRTCPGCGERVVNPKVSMGCAQWCEYAEQCLGFDPKTLRQKETVSTALSERVAHAVEVEFAGDQRRIAHAKAVLEHARAIMTREGGDPRVAVAAALLHDIGIREAERKYGSAAPKHQEAEGPPIAGRILRELGFGPEASEHVQRIVGSHHSAGDIDTVEFRIIWDADRLVNLEAERGSLTPEQLTREAGRGFRTRTGQARAKALFAAEDSRSPQERDDAQAGGPLPHRRREGGAFMAEMLALDPRDTVGRVAADHPASRRVFERLGIDYCCGGARPIGEAAAERGVSLEDLAGAIVEAERAEPVAEEDRRDWFAARLAELADHIEERHHTYMRENLPRLERLFDRVIRAHGERHGKMLVALRGVFEGLRDEVQVHLMKEEQILFPLIREIEAFSRGAGPRPFAHCGTVENPIRQMRVEHEGVGEALDELRRLTADYRLPEDACPTFEDLYRSLRALEDDLHRHIHLENNILFPRAAAQEKQAGVL